VVTRNTAGAATGGTDFMPTQVGLLGKSYGKADHGTIPYDFNYFRVANLAATGQKDITLTLPAGAHPDALLAFGDGLTAGNTKAQVKNSGGSFVGPDGTAATFFTINEPKLPASLDGITSTALRILMSGSPASGMPYLHAGGLQYATGSIRVARDTNATDFAAGAGDNISTATPGIVANGGNITTGTPQIENFNSEPAGWFFSNTPPGPGQPNSSSVSYTDVPGSARINAAAITDTWAPGGATEKPRIFLYYGTPITGDFELETLINLPNGRDTNRHMGLGVVGALPGGTPPDTNLDMTNILMFGPYNPDAMRILKGDNNDFSDFGPGGYTANTYYLRLRKAGNLFTGWASTDGVNWGDPIATYTFSHALPSVYVGFLSKSWFQASGVLPLDFDYFKISPLTTNGTYESRVLDLGATGLTPRIETLGGNSIDAQLQFRAADTVAALASQPYTGPDGTAGTYFAGNFVGSLPEAFTGKQYFQYRATLPPLTQLNDLAVVGLTVANPLATADVISALRIAGGFQAATAQDMARLDVAKGASSGHIDILDAAQILRTINGK
jgi:hypothetical protein